MRGIENCNNDSYPLDIYNENLSPSGEVETTSKRGILLNDDASPSGEVDINNINDLADLKKRAALLPTNRRFGRGCFAAGGLFSGLGCKT